MSINLPQKAHPDTKRNESVLRSKLITVQLESPESCREDFGRDEAKRQETEPPLPPTRNGLPGGVTLGCADSDDASQRNNSCLGTALHASVLPNTSIAGVKPDRNDGERKRAAHCCCYAVATRRTLVHVARGQCFTDDRFRIV